MNKNLILLFVVGVFLIAGVSAICAERTLSGAWCQNVPLNEVDTDYSPPAPTSCDATTFCQMGTCIDNTQGTCTSNTPKRLCSENGGFWTAGKPEEIPQCKRGCCFMGDNAAFVTQTTCKSFATLYSTNVDFRANINNEFQCIASVTSEVKGACVLESELGQRTCTFVKQSECAPTGGEFHQGLLCTAESLHTICAMDKKTTCVIGKDEVYFTDTCGNVANVYDVSRQNDIAYWTTVIEPEESCSYGNSNSNSANCGNCNYFAGSTCKAYQRGQESSPTLGNNICRDLSCEYEGKTYDHGEKWCVNPAGTNNPGTESYKLECRNNEVIVEQCDPRRATVCTQSEVEGFTNAKCVPNAWQNCVAQTKKDDCLNPSTGDCNWVEDYTWEIYNPQNKKLFGDDKGKVEGYGVCVPKYPSGFEFWNSDGQSEDICGLGTVTCTVTYEKGLLDSWDVKYNEECIPGNKNHNAFLEKAEGVCSALGDCGSSVNYKNQKSYNKKEFTKAG